MHATARPQTGQHPSQVGQHPSQFGQYLSQFGRYPSQVGQYPSQVGQHPSQVGQYPSQVGQYPSQVGQYPSQVGQHPSQVGQHPSQVGQPPSQVGQPPSQVGQHPSQVGQYPLQNCSQSRTDPAQNGQHLFQAGQYHQERQYQSHAEQHQPHTRQYQPQIRRDQFQAGHYQPRIIQDQSQAGHYQLQIRQDQSQVRQYQPQIRQDQSQAGRYQPQIRQDQYQAIQYQPQIRQDQSSAGQTLKHTRVSSSDVGDRNTNGNQIQGVFPSKTLLLLAEGEAQAQNGAFQSGQGSNCPVTPAPSLGLQPLKNVNQCSTINLKSLLQSKTTIQSLNHTVVSPRDSIALTSHTVQPGEKSTLEQAFSNSTSSLRSSNQQSPQALPLHCQEKKGFYVSVSEDRSGNGFKVDSVVFLGTQRKVTRWDQQGFSPSENPQQVQFQQSSAKISQQRNNPQKLTAKPPLTLQLLGPPNKPHNSSQKAVAVVQPLSQPDHQGPGLRDFSREANDLHKSTTDESSSIPKETSRPSADHNANCTPLKDPGPVDQNRGLESTTEERVLATTGQNTGASTVMCSDPITPEITKPNEVHATGPESEITNGTQCQVTSISQSSVTTPLPRDNTDKMKEIKRKDDQAAESFFSSVPIIPWTYDKWTKLIEKVTTAHMQSEPTEDVNVAKKILTMFWEESYENVLMKTDCFVNLINSVEEFCSKHVRPDTVVFNYASKKSLKQRCHVLEHGCVPPEETYKSSWLNTNEQLDDIDKEFGFPWSLKYHLMDLDRDPQPHVMEKENGIVGHATSKAQDEVSPTEFTAPPVGQNVENVLSTEDDVHQTPETLEMSETESIDHDYSFKICVLSPEEARIIFEEIKSGQVKTAEMDNQSKKDVDNSVVEDMPGMVNINLNEVKKSEVQVSTPEFCCITKLMEVMSGSNKKSLCNCQCTQDPSPDDVTVNRFEIGKEVQVEKLNVISLEFAMEDEMEAELGNNTDDETRKFKRKKEPTETILPFMKKMKVKAPLDLKTQPTVVDGLIPVSENTDELEPDSSNATSVKLALYGSSPQQSHSKHNNGTDVNNRGSLKCHLPSKKSYFSNETLPPPTTITVNANYKKKGPSEPVPEVGSLNEQMLPEIGRGTTSKCSSPSEQPVEQNVFETAPILSCQVDKPMEVEAKLVKKRIHEQWKHHHVPTKKKFKNKVVKLETHSSESQHKVRPQKAKAAASTSREDLQLSTKGRSAAMTKTKQPLSPSAKQNFLSLLRQRIAKSRTRLDLPKQQTEVRSMYETGNPIFKPFQGRSVLKFTVLPNTFLFNDKPANAEESSHSPIDTPAADDATNKHHNTKTRRPKGEWVPRREKKATPRPGPGPQVDGATNTFQQYQQKFIRQRQEANKKNTE